MMPENFKNTFEDLNHLSGKRLYKVLGITFVIFIFLGVIIGYFKPTNLTKNEQPQKEETVNLDQNVSYKGVVTNLGPNDYTSEKIDYALNDINGNEIILLRANDEKLKFAEGMYLTVSGRKTKTRDGKADVLQVLEVIMKNEAD